MLDTTPLVDFSREFQVALEPIPFSHLKKGNLFFTVHQYNSSALASHLMIKLGYHQAMMIEQGFLGEMKQRDYVYLVVRKNG